MSEKKTILVVDDDPDFAESVSKLLQRNGFNTLEAHDGVEGIAMARQHKPDAMVLDVMMPNKDGYDACRELKADPETQNIPILLLTAVASHVPTTKYTHHDGMTTDADDYLDKGSEPEEIMERVKDLLEDLCRWLYAASRPLVVTSLLRHLPHSPAPKAPSLAEIGREGAASALLTDTQAGLIDTEARRVLDVHVGAAFDLTGEGLLFAFADKTRDPDHHVGTAGVILVARDALHLEHGLDLHLLGLCAGEDQHRATHSDGEGVDPTPQGVGLGAVLVCLAGRWATR
jgi:two-component system alkaline phosphatase synthesis response regulator PhoP